MKKTLKMAALAAGVALLSLKGIAQQNTS